MSAVNQKQTGSGKEFKRLVKLPEDVRKTGDESWGIGRHPRSGSPCCHPSAGDANAIEHLIRGFLGGLGHDRLVGLAMKHDLPSPLAQIAPDIAPVAAISKNSLLPLTAPLPKLSCGWSASPLVKSTALDE
jgi:hypothetical protein